MARPDALSGSLTWCIVGPAAGGAAHAREIGDYHVIAYEGIVRRARVAPQVGALLLQASVLHAAVAP